MDIVTLSLAKKFAKQISAGYSNVEVQGTTLIFTLNNGTKTYLKVPEPVAKDPVSIENVEIDENNHVICTFTNGEVVDAGEVKVVVDESKIKSLKTIQLVNKNLIFTFTDNSEISVDLSSLGGGGSGGLTPSQINAVESMRLFTEGKNLMIDYDENELPINFYMEDKNLIVDEDIDDLELNVNDNGELEVNYYKGGK